MYLFTKEERNVSKTAASHATLLYSNNTTNNNNSKSENKYIYTARGCFCVVLLPPLL